MRKLFWILTLIFLPFIAEAGNQVSGYISLTCLGGNTYQATITDYTLGPPCAGVPIVDTLRIWWGDGTSDLIFRSNGNGDSVCNCRVVSTFVGTHTYPGPGIYKIWFDAQDRIPFIMNMTNSVAQSMLIYHTLVISPFSTNCIPSPVITNPPVCAYACLSKCYYFNLGAYSPSGDSLSYSLGNIPAAGYYIPSGVTIDSVTGKLSWCSPSTLGLYNFAILIITHHHTVVDSVKLQSPVDTEEVELQVEVDSTCILGINEVTNKSGYSIYPNPSNKGIFTVSCHSERSEESQTIMVYNVFGEGVFTEILRSTQDDNLINLSTEPNGIYFYRVLNKDGSLLGEGKIIIQK